MITAVLGGALLLVGLFFVLVAALGLVRMPDFYSRTHAAAKAGAFGGSLILLGVAVLFATWGVAVKAVLVILFFYATTPVAGHMIGRAAYLARVPRWPGTEIDELAGKYDLTRRHLAGWRQAEEDRSDQGT